jgi:hypothetical protein
MDCADFTILSLREDTRSEAEISQQHCKNTGLEPATEARKSPRYDKRTISLWQRRTAKFQSGDLNALSRAAFEKTDKLISTAGIAAAPHTLRAFSLPGFLLSHSAACVRLAKA